MNEEIGTPPKGTGHPPILEEHNTKGKWCCACEYDEAVIEAKIAFAVSELENKIEHHNNIIKERLRYCEEQNGMDECKNCGLCEEDIIKL